MKRMKSYKVKGANSKQGKLVDNSRLVDKKEYARGKDETHPEIKFTSHEAKSKKPETLVEYVDMLEAKTNEDIGVY